MYNTNTMLKGFDMNIMNLHIIEKKRKTNNKTEQYVVMPVSRKVLHEKSKIETSKAILFDNIWIPKSLLSYTTSENLMSMPLWWVQKTIENTNSSSKNVSKVLSPLTLSQLRNILNDDDE